MGSLWRKVLTRENVDLTTISAIDLVFYDIIRKYTKRKREVFFTFCSGKTMTHYASVDMIGIGRYLLKKHFSTPQMIKMHYKNGRRLWMRIEKSTTSLSRKLTSHSSLPAFLHAFAEFKKQFEDICGIYSICSWLAIESWQSDIDVLLKDLIPNARPLSQAEIFAAIYRPWKKTAMIQLQEKIQRGVPIPQLVKEYQFLRNWAAVWYRPIDADWIQKIGTLPQQVPSLSFAKALHMLKPSHQAKKLLLLAPYITFFKDWRDDLRRYHTYAWSFLFEKMAGKFHIPVQDLGYLTLEEIEQMLRSGKVQWGSIERRKEHMYVVTIRKQQLRIQVFDKKIEKYQHIVQMITEREKQTVIRGIIAQPGTATGKVRLIRTFHDTKHVGYNEILVANTTHPEYLPAMHKAAAFITNEGGIISHAAIVAREMKKPCIVGTKIATKVLKDGDLVEVDANRGIVRKL